MSKNYLALLLFFGTSSHLVCSENDSTLVDSSEVSSEEVSVTEAPVADTSSNTDVPVSDTTDVADPLALAAEQAPAEADAQATE